MGMYGGGGGGVGRYTHLYFPSLFEGDGLFPLFDGRGMYGMGVGR